jgi:hypothetical protein
MEHLTECEHAFIKNGVAEHIFIFDKSAHDTPLIDTIKEEQGCDTVVCLCDYGSKVARWSTWDGTTFTEPTLDYLYSIGISNENEEMRISRKIEEAARDAAAQAKADAKSAVLEKLGLTQDIIDLLVN